MPRPFEFQDLVASGESARDAQRIERRLGSGTGVVDDVRARIASTSRCEQDFRSFRK
jgi:hypothetical protein